MEYSFIPDLEISVNLTTEEILCADEWICRGEKSYEANIGHTWYGFMNLCRYTWNDNRILELAGEQPEPNPPLTCTTRFMDTVVLKSMEMRNYTEDQVAKDLFNKLFKVLRHAIEYRGEMVQPNFTL